MNFPQHNHPLTLAYIRSVYARSHESMREVSRTIAALEDAADETMRAQCKLAAEVLIERRAIRPGDL